MKREEVIGYLGKRVRVVTKAGMKYAGKLLKVDKGVIIIDDRYDGEVTIDFFEISSIGLFRSGRLNYII